MNNPFSYPTSEGSYFFDPQSGWTEYPPAAGPKEPKMVETRKAQRYDPYFGWVDIYPNTVVHGDPPKYGSYYFTGDLANKEPTMPIVHAPIGAETIPDDDVADLSQCGQIGKDQQTYSNKIANDHFKATMEQVQASLRKEINKKTAEELEKYMETTKPTTFPDEPTSSNEYAYDQRISDLEYGIAVFRDIARRLVEVAIKHGGPGDRSVYPIIAEFVEIL